MSTVTFPGLGLTLHLNRVAFSIGTFHVYWYGIIIALGFFFGVAFCCAQAKKFGLKPDDILDMIIFAAPGGIIGARLYYIFFNPDLYRNPDGSWSLAACLSTRNGGLAIYGGIIAGVFIAWLVARYKKIPFPALADVCAFGLLIGQIAGRWGNFMNREAHGAVTDTFLKMGLQDASGVVTYYHPTFLYESVWNLIGFIGLHFFSKKRKFDGEVFLAYVAWYGLGRVWIEGLRTDSLYLFSTGIRVSQLVAAVSFLAAAGILAWVLVKKKPARESLYVNRKRVEPQADEKQDD